MPGNRQVFSTAINAADRARWNSQWEEAAQEYQRALAEFPEDVTARGSLGFCYMQTKQWQKALDEYEYILENDMSNIIALSKIAELYGILGRRDDAYQAYLHLADLYSRVGQGGRAEAAWQKGVQLSPGSPEPHQRLASYYFEKKDIALMIHERLTAAQGYLARNEPGQARAQCEEVLRVDATHALAQQMLLHIRSVQEAHKGNVENIGDMGSGATGRAGTPASSHGPGASIIASNPSQSPREDTTSGPLAFTDSSRAAMGPTGNISGGNTGIMGNTGSADNYGGVGNAESTFAAGAGGTMNTAPRKHITASQVTGVLKQAQMFQSQGRYNDAIDLCEQILESGFDRPDAVYFLGWLYQEQQRWDEAIRRFQALLNDPDYALSCYYALGQCYRARGDLRTATVHFDEAVDRVNLDVLTIEESDQLVQLCQEAAEAHRMLGEQEQALTVYNALLGFLRSRGWNDKVAQVEFMLQQAQNAPLRPPTPPAGTTRVLTTEQMAQHMSQSPPVQQPLSDAATMAFNVNNMNTANAAPGQMGQPAQSTQSAQPIQPSPSQASSVGDLPDWLTGILSEPDKSQLANNKQQPSAVSPSPTPQPLQPPVTEQPTMEQSSAFNNGIDNATAQRVPSSPLASPAPLEQQPTQQAQQVPSALPASSSWLTEDSKPTNSVPVPSSEQSAAVPASEPHVLQEPAQAIVSPAPTAQSQESTVAPFMPVPAELSPSTAVPSWSQPVPPVAEPRQQPSTHSVEDLLSQIAGTSSQDEELKHVAEAVLASTASLPDNIRLPVVRAMQDIQRYINHGLLTPATEECLRIIEMAPQYLDVHQVLCEIYVRQGKVEQAITKYAILIDTYVVNGRIDDAIATYRRILQLEPDNLTYRMRLINLLSSQGNKEDLLHERTLVAESYLRLGYTDRALTLLEQALQESPTSVSTRLNYALALQKLGRQQQAVTEYQRVLQIDPRNLTALVRWHIAMMTTSGTARATTLEALSRIRWQLRGEGQKYYDAVVREYTQAADMNPNNADIAYALGQVHQQAGQFEKAIDAYNQAMWDKTVEVLACTDIAQCLLTQGKPDMAIQALERALQGVRRTPAVIDPSIWAARPREEGEQHQAPEVEISLMLAKAYERTGRREQMEAILRQVRQTKAGQDEVSSTLAEISARQGDAVSALQEYSDLVRHYRNARQTDNALNVLNEMVRMDPQDPRAHSELADIYISRGLLEEGIAELRLLSDIYQRRNQTNQAADALERIGSVYAEMGDSREALSNLRHAADLNPGSMELLREVVGFCLQLAYQVERDDSNAATQYQDIAAEYQLIIARHYFDTHQVKESVAALQQLITIDRSNFEAYDMLGQTYQSVGEYEQASRVYRNLARIAPNSSLAHERLATLQELRAR